MTTVYQNVTFNTQKNHISGFKGLSNLTMFLAAKKSQYLQLHNEITYVTGYCKNHILSIKIPPRIFPKSGEKKSMQKFNLTFITANC